MAVIMTRVNTETIPLKTSPDSNHPLSILYVDDDPTLLNVGKIYLERCSDLSVTTASCVKSALTLLKIFRFDVILSDYQMPGIDGIGFLKILQENGCTIPFILFTGKGREEVVIEAINHGATYYVQKGGSPKAQFAELEHKIREASRRRRAETALREVELQYRTLFEYSGTSVVTLDDGMRITSANAGFLQLTGYSRDELAGGLYLTDLTAAHDTEILLEQYNNLRSGLIPAISGLEILLVTKHHQIMKLSITAAIIPTTDRSIVSMVHSSLMCPSEGALRKNPGDRCKIENSA
jgi:PAS domain S-box-containing protein